MDKISKVEFKNHILEKLDLANDLSKNTSELFTISDRNLYFNTDVTEEIISYVLDADSIADEYDALGFTNVALLHKNTIERFLKLRLSNLRESRKEFILSQLRQKGFDEKLNSIQNSILKSND